MSVANSRWRAAGARLFNACRSGSAAPFGLSRAVPGPAPATIAMKAISGRRRTLAGASTKLGAGIAINQALSGRQRRRADAGQGRQGGCISGVAAARAGRHADVPRNGRRLPQGGAALHLPPKLKSL
jgi:hypothetical protein